MKAIIEHAEALTAAQEAFAASNAKLAPPKKALAEANRVVAVEVQRQAAYTDLAARAIVDPEAIPVEDLEAATVAMTEAATEAAAARMRIPSLERAIGLLQAEADAKAYAVRDVRQWLDRAIAEWLKVRAEETFDRYRSALNEISLSIAAWNAHSQLIDKLDPANAPLMVYTGSEPWKVFLFACPGGPDQNPFKQSDHGSQWLQVATGQIDAEKSVIRGELLEQAGVRI